MGDYHVMMQFEIAAAPDEVRRWITSTDGIAGWWSDRVVGRAGAVGDTFTVAFPTSPVDFDLEVTTASDDRIEWHIAQNPPWWADTTIRFDISAAADDDGTVLLFSHRDFAPDDPIIAVITPAWAQFVQNLARVSETGQANPAVVN